MQNEIIIRKANEKDFDTIYQFINELEETIFSAEDQQVAFEQNISNSDCIYLVAELNEQPIGFISCHAQVLLHHGGQKIGEIQEMYVSTENRKMGVGKKLIDELKKVAIQNGIAQLEVTSNKKRLKTHQFYQRESFINSHEKFTFRLH